MLIDFLFVLVGGLKFGAIYALGAIGLVVIHKATKTVNFAHGALIMLGAYATFFLLERFKLPYWAVYVLAPTLVGAVSAFLEFAILRPIRRADMFIVIIATVFLAIALQEAVRLPYDVEMLSVAAVLEGDPLFLGDLIVTQESMWIIAGAFLFAILGALLFAQAGLGRSMRAMAQNIRGAQLCGYSVDGVYVFAWFVGGGLAGLAGVFSAPSLGVSPELMVATIVPAFVAAVIGGFDSLRGAILGGLILGIVENIAATYISAGLKSAISFLILFAVLMIRPEGLFPEGRVRKV
ncbi:MAG: branched-chain amino acid ABC transporter permease [Alphaproteobacteria bacterium]|nr:branched-chain amino acid ABC transporter permease [Alphaproteobacteria bacterium]